MDRKELEIIQELMQKLQEQMELGEDDFSERLGRKKPEVEVMKMELESEEPMEEDMELSEHMEEMEPKSPDDALKQRLMKLRSGE